MKKIAVFCGSSIGASPIYAAQTTLFAKLLVERGYALVYGGARTGLMGVLADEVLAAGGYVIGVMPQHLVDKELAHPELHELYIVQDMHERKAKMSALADAFVALPGGTGTLEEIFEQWTWAQLGLHTKPCGFLNIADYYTPLFAMLQQMTETGFTHLRHLEMLRCHHDSRVLLDLLEQYQAPTPKWQQAQA